MLEENPQLCQADLSAEKKVFSRIGFSVLLMLLLAFTVQVFVSAIVTVVAPDVAHSLHFIMISNTLTIYFIATPCALALLKKIPAYRIEKNKISAGRFIKILIICLGIAFIGSLVGNGLAFVMGLVFKKAPVNVVEKMVSESFFWTRFVSFVLIAPIVEEYFFREALIRKTIKYGEGTAILISAVLFSLLHGNLYQLFYAFGLGAVFAYVYIRTGRLRYPIALHMIVNVLGAVVAPAVSDFAAAGEVNSIVGGMYYLAYFAAAITGIVLFFKNARNTPLKKGVCVLPKEKRGAILWLNAGTISYFVLCSLFIIVNIVI